VEKKKVSEGRDSYNEIGGYFIGKGKVVQKSSCGEGNVGWEASVVRRCLVDAGVVKTKMGQPKIDQTRPGEEGRR